MRPTDAAEGFGELPKLAVGGLSDEDAKVLLATRSPFPLDDQVRDRLVAEAPAAVRRRPRAGRAGGHAAVARAVAAVEKR